LPLQTNKLEDASFRNNLSPIARKACEIVDRIRAEELRSTWTPATEDLLAQKEQLPLFPGMMFTHAKAQMEETKLWRIVRRLPKGCLLHAHLDATVDFEFLVAELLRTPGMHLACEDGSLASSKAREVAPLNFRYRKATKPGVKSIWDEEYEKGTYVLLSKAAAEFPEGGKEGFLTWLKGRCTVSSTDSVEQHRGIDAIWKKFAMCFVVVGSIIHYEPVFRAFLRRLMGLLMADGVRYAEVRYDTGPLSWS
jgi:adenosine deaminase CECR1